MEKLKDPNVRVLVSDFISRVLRNNLDKNIFEVQRANKELTVFLRRSNQKSTRGFLILLDLRYGNPLAPWIVAFEE